MVPWLFIGLFAACGSGRGAPIASTSPSDEVPSEDASRVNEVVVAEAPCIEKFDVGSATSVLDEHRAHTKVHDFHTRFRASVIDPDAQKPVSVVAKYTAGGTPLMWFTPDYADVVVNQAALGDLVVVDATNLAAGSEHKVGQRTELVLGLLSNRDLVRFLIDARVVATWVHIGASLCLANETTTDDGVYTAHFTGSHTMFTSEERVEKLDFAIVIDDEGNVTVRGSK